MSAIVRRPGGAIVPYEAMDRARANPTANPIDVLEPLARLAEPLRDEYCAIADRLPTFPPGLGNVLTGRSLLNRAICAGTANPRPPIRGQCPGVVYDVFGVVFGFTTSGAPLRTDFTSVGVTGLWGEILDCRISGFSAGRWSLEVLCRGASGNAINPPGLYTWRGIGSTGLPNTYNQVLGASIEAWYTARRDGLPDNCAVPPPPGDPLPVGSPIFTLPRIQSRFLPDVEIEVSIAPSLSLYPTLNLDIQGTIIEAQFTMEGIEFNFPDSDFNFESDLAIDIAGQVTNNLQLQLDNQTTAIELSLQGQITQQNNFIEEQNNELEIELANTIENAIEIALGDVTVDVDLSPVLIELDIIQDLLDDPLECPELDLTPVLDKLEQLDEKYSERLDNLEQSLKDKIDDAVDKLECYLQAIIARLPLRRPDNTSRVGSFTSSQSDTVTTISLPTGILAVGVVITEYDKNFIRIYKVDDSAIEVEGGFGHISLVAFNGILDFVLLATRRQTLAINPDVPPSGIRLSLKPGVTVDVFATAIAPQEPVVCE